MSRWVDVETEAPALAAAARRYLDAHTHKVIATLRRDGSPRVSGTECIFAGGDLWFGSMWRARKALDLLRDPRFSLHSGSDDAERWSGDAKVTGMVEEVTDPDRIEAVYPGAAPGPMHVFRADVSEVVVVSLAPSKDRLVIEAWHAGRGLSRHER